MDTTERAQGMVAGHVTDHVIGHVTVLWICVGAKVEF